MNDLKSANLSDLVEDYFNKTDARLGAKAIASNVPENKLDRLLRSHLIQEVVSQREIKARDGLDDLLAFYSILEIAFLCGVITELPTVLENQARKHLSRPAVRRYYEKFYPILLPVLFLERLNGASRFDVYDFPHVFAGFLTLNTILDDEDVQIFLWLLDDGTIEEEDSDCDLADVLRVLQDSKGFAKRILTSPEDQVTVDQALHGFVKFSGFCFEFDKLLGGNVHKLIKSAMWHFHGYWFGQIGGQVLGVISAAIEQYRSWVPPVTARTSSAKAALIDATKQSMDQGQTGLQRLTSSFYRFTLESAILERSRFVMRSKIEGVVEQIALGNLYPAIRERHRKNLETGSWNFPTMGA